MRSLLRHIERGASAWRRAGRVAFWGALAMALTAWVGALFGTSH